MFSGPYSVEYGNIIKKNIEKIKEKNLINLNNNKYIENEELKIGKLGIIYKGQNIETKNEILIISINLFKLYENNNSKNEYFLIEEIKEIINNIKKSNQKIYDIYIKENSINFVIEKYELNFENYFISKNKELNFEEIKNFIVQLNIYIKIYKDLNINLNYISPKNILVKKENNEIKYQFLFYYNRIILDNYQIIISPEIKNKINDYSKSDLWNIGILLYYISMKGNYPFNSFDNYSLIEEEIKNGILYDNLKENNLSNLIIKLLKYNKDERIEWKEYFNYKFNKIIPKNLDILGKNRNPISKNEIDILCNKVLSICKIEYKIYGEIFEGCGFFVEI